MMRFVIPVALFCVFGAGFMWIQSQFASEEKREAEVYVDEADRELQNTLRELAAAWNPRKKRRVLVQAKTRSATIGAPLLSLLDRPRHPKLSSAMFLAAELGLEAARPKLVALMSKAPRDLRAESALAAARLQPWKAEEVAALLLHADDGMRLAGLVCWKREPSPENLATVLSIVEGSDREFARAAIDALPKSLPAEHKQQLRERFSQQTGAARASLALAMGCTGVEREDEELLVQALWDEDAAVRRAALIALRHKKGRLKEARAIFEIIQEGADAREAALALYCLERTASVEASDLRNRLASLRSPLSTYFGARCLVKRGATQALPLLVDCLEGGNDATNLAVQALSRRLLSRLSGKKPLTAVAEWRSWIDDRPRFSPRALDALTP